MYHRGVYPLNIKLAQNVQLGSFHAYRFVDEVITELLDIHNDIQPLKMFHFGGDEVPMDAWVKSPKCIAFLENVVPEVPENEQRNYIKEHFIHVRYKESITGCT